MRMKWYGTATILLESNGTQLLFDPFFSRNYALFRPPADELSATDAILLTHGHLDHIVDVPAISIINIGNQTNPSWTLIATGKVITYVRDELPGQYDSEEVMK